MLLLSLVLYQRLEASWLLFAAFILGPDLGMLGYLVSPKLGALTYNILHTYVMALGLLVIGLVFSQPLLLTFGLIMTAHIGGDRLLGFGLKYPTAFQDTHLQRL